MRRRSSKSATPLTAKQQELALRENELREKMQKLERMIAEAPRVAKEKVRRQQEEVLARASAEGSRLDVSMSLRDLRHLDGGRPSATRRGSLRKERREGRIIFLVLVLVLAAAVI
jgi:hypothetical protein